MKLKTQKGLLFCALAASLAGVSGTAAAQQFTASATVQNAVTINQVTPLNFGTVFATATVAPDGANDNTHSSKLTLAAAGTVSATTGAGAPQVLGLGGHTAGQYAAPGLPTNSTVAVRFTTENDEAFTPAATAAAAACAYNSAADALAADKIPVVHSSGDPSIGFFCLDVFTSNRLNLFTTGYSLGFGVSELTFNLGGTLVGQAPLAGATRNFEAGAYTGTFGMEVYFP